MTDLSSFESLDKLIASSHHSARRCRKPDGIQGDGHGRGRQIICWVPGPAVANLLTEGRWSRARSAPDERCRGDRRSSKSGTPPVSSMRSCCISIVGERILHIQDSKRCAARESWVQNSTARIQKDSRWKWRYNDVRGPETASHGSKYSTHQEGTMDGFFRSSLSRNGGRHWVSYPLATAPSQAIASFPSRRPLSSPPESSFFSWRGSCKELRLVSQNA